MTKKEAIRKSIKHWEDMIAWVEKQDKNGIADHTIMFKGIGQWWCGDHCSLCDEYFFGEIACKKCPLKIKYGTCCGPSKNKWSSVDDSTIWGEWTKNAKLFLKQLKSLDKKA